MEADYSQIPRTIITMKNFKRYFIKIIRLFEIESYRNIQTDQEKHIIFKTLESYGRNTSIEDDNLGI